MRENKRKATENRKIWEQASSLFSVFSVVFVRIKESDYSPKRLKPYASLTSLYF